MTRDEMRASVGNRMRGQVVNIEAMFILELANNGDKTSAQTLTDTRMLQTVPHMHF